MWMDYFITKSKAEIFSSSALFCKSSKYCNWDYYNRHLSEVAVCLVSLEVLGSNYCQENAEDFLHFQLELSFSHLIILIAETIIK
jgi:hypothetical protein